MRWRNALWLVLSVLAGVSASPASTIAPDPAIIIVGGFGSIPVGLTFSFATPGGTPFICTFNNVNYACQEFQNVSGVGFFNMLLSYPTTANVTCQVVASGSLSLFSFCTPGSTQALFAGGSGINFNGVFVIGVSGWLPTTFNVQANIPEPATLGLLATGIGALFAGRLLRRRSAGRRKS
jgi:hypothetical protein